jgi:hypothetical protein
VPKRSDQRIRRNKPDVPIDKVTAIGPVEVPQLGLVDPHPIISQLWSGMVASAQARYFEPTDWAFARLTLHFADAQVKAGRVNGQVLATVHSMLSDLLVTEGSRRKVRVEVEREAVKDNVVDIAQLFRERLAAKK